MRDINSTIHSTAPQIARRIITITIPTGKLSSSDVSAGTGLPVDEVEPEGLLEGLAEAMAEGLAEGMGKMFVAVGSPRTAAETTPQS